jgi:hypothetical protein
MAGKKTTAKKAPKKSAKKSNRRQGDLLEGAEPGARPPISIPEVDEAAGDYVRKRDRRMELTKLEVGGREAESPQGRKRLGRGVTTDTLNRHVANYRAGNITLKDHNDMVEELVARRERLGDALERVEENFDKMKQEFVESLQGEN